MRGRMLGVLILLLSTAPAWSSAAAAGEPGGPVWVWPLAGPRAVSRPFDPPSTRYGPGHRGADLPGASGQVVRAAGAGRVSYAGLLAGRGVVVVVHGALRTTYEPVTASVRPGQQVTAGQPIGVLVAGHAGCAGTCLHWGLLRGSVYLDPVQLVSRGPSRLLPLTGPVPAPLPAPLPQERGRPLAAALASPAADAPAPRPAAQPSFALRAADVGWGALALMALILGLALLLRPRRPPAGPAAPPYAVAVSQPPGLVDLATERSRRRAGVA